MWVTRLADLTFRPIATARGTVFATVKDDLQMQVIPAAFREIELLPNKAMIKCKRAVVMTKSSEIKGLM